MGPDQTPPYKNPTLPTHERVVDLVARMTLDEKLAQLGSAWVFELLTDMRLDQEKAMNHMRYGLGHITRVAGASSLKPKEGAALANEIQRFLRDETRLGIPAIVHEECCSGYMARNATCFPQIIGLASTWEPELTGRMAEIVRRQMRDAGAHQGLSPLLDVVRDPRWGRVEETFGEDPYLVALNGVEFVRGLQADSWEDRIIATAKHFVGYGVPDGGFNWNPAHIPARELREIYLLPFEAAVKEAGLLSIMNGYNELDGVPCAASEELLDTILRREWGFDGVVVSDYFSIDQIEVAHHVSGSKGESAIKALSAGLDIELPNTDCYGAPLKQAVEAGEIDIAVVEQSVARLLTQKFELGLFENRFVDDQAVELDTPADRALAREIAQKSMILLKNEDSLLPLDRSIGQIALIGPQVESIRNLVGDYSYIAHIETLMEARENTLGGGMAMPIPDAMEIDESFVEMRTIAEAMRAYLPSETVLNTAEGCDVLGDDRSRFEEAVTAAAEADVAIVCLGGKSGLTDDCTCGEARDRAELTLTGVQQELLEAIHATGTPVVLVLINGRPLSITWAAEEVPAIIEAWLPGEEGAEALVEILFGEVNPSGKLPITVPRHVGQVPIYYNHKPSGGRSHWKESYVDLSHKPLWPFGFGLSYTDFELSALEISTTELKAGESIDVSVEIKNVGRRVGSEVIQLYSRDLVGSITRPLKELKGFARVGLVPGESKTITFSLRAERFAFLDQSMSMVLEPGKIRVMVGTSSEDLPLSAEFNLIGDVTRVEQRPFFTEVKLSG